MKLTLTTEEKIRFLQGIIDSSNRTMDTYVKSIYKEIIENLKDYEKIKKELNKF